ncbi:MAG: tetratricopeptide repeat protein [Myxococcales bacterium]|nr:tetratricopeptide repeat protein [Myxococcales bacterium]
MRCPTNEALLAYAAHSIERAHAFEAAHAQELDQHLDDCPTCRGVVRGALASGPTAIGTPQPGPPGGRTPTAAAPSPAGEIRLGDRYEVKRLLGRGGMGAVYLARDRTLGRDVAVKLHGVGSGGERLHREAIAMAKLAHPNVVTVFEVASFEDRLYVAMEYVKGGTLSSWLRTEPRTWRQIVELLIGAGEGLAAAHAADLVHRDFKPDNVLVGEDGRARVSDFGIARLESRPSDRILAIGSESTPNAPMTVTGSVLGTPAYMAPEQLVGDPVDARADQFAFCVVAWECLFGARPFSGTSLATLAASISVQALERPAKSAVPQRVVEIISRGLAADPEARYPDLPMLLAALRTTVGHGRRRWVIAGVALAAVPIAIVATMFATRGGGHAGEECGVGLEALAGAWDPPIRDQLRAVFVAARPKDGAQIHTRVATAFDAYATSWLAARRSACEATRVRGEQSEAALDLRMSCLDRKRTELGALTRELATADAALVMGSQRAAIDLSSLAACDDVAGLSAPVQPPDPASRARVEALRAQLAEANAQRVLGRTVVGLAKAQVVVAQATALKYRPLEAEALLLAGDLEERAGDAAKGTKTLEQAIVAANAGNHKLAAAEAWSRLAWVVGYRERDFDRAMLAVQMAAAAIEGAGGNAELSAQLTNYEALILETKGKLPEAKQRYLASLAAYERLGEHDSPKIALVLNDLGGVERKLGNHAAALEHLERALAIRTHAFGENHPWVFSSVVNIGNVAWSKGDYAGAERSFQRALAIAAEVFPANHPQTALALANLASVYDHQDKLTESIATYRRALAIYEGLRGPTHPDVADTLRNMANVLIEDHQIEPAKQAFERALSIMTDKTDDPSLPKLLADYGQLLIHDDPRRAEDLLLRAIKLGEAASTTDPELAYPLTALGELHEITQRASTARPLLERALTLRAAEEDGDAEAYAGTELVLARVLWLVPADRPRALALATAAKARLDKASATKGKAYLDVVGWLDAHGPKKSSP